MNKTTIRVCNDFLIQEKGSSTPLWGGYTKPNFYKSVVTFSSKHTYRNVFTIHVVQYECRLKKDCICYVLQKKKTIH